jgi:hypothetical protein
MDYKKNGSSEFGVQRSGLLDGEFTRTDMDEMDGMDRRSEVIMKGTSVWHPSPRAQWLPKPATSQLPEKRRSLRELWSPLKHSRSEGGGSVAQGLVVGCLSAQPGASARVTMGLMGSQGWSRLGLKIKAEFKRI